MTIDIFAGTAADATANLGEITLTKIGRSGGARANEYRQNQERPPQGAVKPDGKKTTTPRKSGNC